MNKVVPTVLALSALLVVAGCSSSGSSRTSHNTAVKASHASYSAQTNCASGCQAGYHQAGHAHSNQSGAAIRHSHAGSAGHAHSGYSAGYGYTMDAGVSAGRNTIVRTSAQSGAGAVASSGGGAGGSTLVKIAGALLVGGLIYNATKDDDDDNKTTTTGTTTTPTCSTRADGKCI